MDGSRRPWWRSRWSLVLGVPLVLVALVLLLAELALVLAGIGEAPRFFARERADDGSLWLVANADPPRPGTVFRSVRFAARPTEGTTRVACLGGSTTHGHPFEPPGAFSDWLAVRLPELLPGRAFEVLNLGANAWDAKTVLELLEELEDVELDLLVVYAGHNEFLQANLGAVRRPARTLVARLARATRLGRTITAALRRGDAPAEPALSRVAVAVRHEPFLSAAELDRGRRRFRDALRGILDLARRRGIAVLLCRPVSDLRDTPPEACSFAAHTTTQERQDFLARLATLQALRDEVELGGATGSEEERTRWRALLEHLDSLDGSVALLPWLEGRLELLRGDVEEARLLLEQARDRDGHPIRAERRIQAILGDLATRFAVPLADPGPLFDAASGGVPGQADLFVDYCHPDLEGQRLIAEAIVASLAGSGVLAPLAEWRFDGEPSLEEYRQRMGLDATAQARSLANRALFALGTGYFDSEDADLLAQATSLLDLALRTGPGCTLAHLGLGTVSALRGDRDACIASFTAAEQLDPAATREYLGRIRAQPVVLERFEELGLRVLEDRVEVGSARDE